MYAEVSTDRTKELIQYSTSFKSLLRLDSMTSVQETKINFRISLGSKYSRVVKTCMKNDVNGKKFCKDLVTRRSFHNVQSVETADHHQ